MLALVIVVVCLVMSLITAFVPVPRIPGANTWALWAIALILLFAVHAPI